jgi:protease-4
LTPGAGSAQRLLRNAAAVPRAVISRALVARPPVFLLVRLGPPWVEGRPARGWRTWGSPPQGFLDLLLALERAASDPAVRGVCIRLAGGVGGLARAAAVRRAILAIRQAGKPVAAYGESIGVEELFVASGATRIWLPESGAVHLVGLRSEGLFLRGLLDELGIRVDVVRVGDHKTAAETFVREDMSPEQRQQLEAILDDVYAELVGGIAEGRGKTASEVRDLIDRGPFTAGEAVAAGLADACRYPDELEASLEELAGLPARPVEGAGPGGPGLRWIDAQTYARWRASDPGFEPLLRDLPRLAYVVLAGPIRRRGGAPRPARSLLARLREDPSLRGLVLRLETPGGDALASDLLWREVELFAREKPVVVSMGEIAASGGYYVAAPAHAIFAEAATLTGSIGVVGGKLDLGALFQRLRIGRDAAERGARAGLLSSARGFTPDERAALRRELESTYRRFVDRVAAGRGLSREAVEAAGQGRVWSGARARTLGLVDALGGPLEALAELRKRAGLREGERSRLEVYPASRWLESVWRWIGAA